MHGQNHIKFTLRIFENGLNMATIHFNNMGCTHMDILKLISKHWYLCFW